MGIETKRDDRANYFALGGDIGFLFERLYGWVVDVHKVDGTKVEVLVYDAYANSDGCLVGHEYDPEAEPHDGQPGGPGVRGPELRIPWADIDVVEVN